MQQVVDGLEAHQGAELLLQESSDIEPSECTDAILGAWRVIEPLPEPGVVLRGEPPRSPGPGAVVERLDSPAVVLRHPILDRPEGGAQGLGNKGCRPPLLGEEDGLESLPGPLLGDSVGQDLELLLGMMVGDEHG
jgi:hypothetical protein